MLRLNGSDRMVLPVNPVLHILLLGLTKTKSSVLRFILYYIDIDCVYHSACLSPISFQFSRCSETSKCQICTHPNHPCSPQYPYEAFKVRQHGTVNGELAMMSALQDGPIVCGMAVTERFERLKNFEIFRDESSDQDLTLAVSIVGYGFDDDDESNDGDGQKYWVSIINISALNE